MDDSPKRPVPLCERDPGENTRGLNVASLFIHRGPEWRAYGLRVHARQGHLLTRWRESPHGVALDLASHSLLGRCHSNLILLFIYAGRL